jgi:hypothetical protein
MRVQLKMEGGLAYFPGLSKPITIDTDALPAEEVDKLKQLLNAAHFFDLPSVINTAAPGAADYHQYTLTVDDDSKHHTVRLTDPIGDSNLQALLTYLKTWRPTPG